MSHEPVLRLSSVPALTPNQLRKIRGRYCPLLSVTVRYSKIFSSDLSPPPTNQPHHVCRQKLLGAPHVAERENGRAPIRSGSVHCETVRRCHWSRPFHHPRFIGVPLLAGVPSCVCTRPHHFSPPSNAQPRPHCPAGARARPTTLCECRTPPGQSCTGRDCASDCEPALSTSPRPPTPSPKRCGTTT